MLPETDELNATCSRLVSAAINTAKDDLDKHGGSRVTQTQQYFAALGFGIAFFVFLTLAFFFAKKLESGHT